MSVNSQKICDILCELPASFAFSNSFGADSSGGKNALAQGTSNLDYLKVDTLEATNVISQNVVTTTINSSISQTFTLQAVEIGGFRLVGDVDANSAIIVNVNIDSGVIDGTVIGSSDPADATFEDLIATGDVIFQGSTGQTCFFWDKSENLLSICGSLFVGGPNTTIESTKLTVNDVIVSISNNTISSPDGKDKGIEFKYYDSGQKLGFFGYDDSIGKFTFYTNATNTNEVISGTIGNFQANTLSVNNINTETGTTSGNNLTLSAGNNIILGATNGNINIPVNTKLTFGTTAYYINSDGTDLNIRSNNDINFGTTGKNINLPTNTCITFGSDAIALCSNDIGNLLLSTTADIFLESSNVNVDTLTVNCINLGGTGATICGDNTNIYIGSTVGYTEFITNIIKLQEDTIVQFGISSNISSTNGELNLNSYCDINLNTGVSCNVNLPEGSCINLGQNSICGISTTIEVSTDEFIISGSTSILSVNCVYLQNADTLICGVSGDITLSTTGSLNLETNTINILENTNINFGSSGTIINSNGINIGISTNAINLLDNTCINFGISVSLCGSSGVLTIDADSIEITDISSQCIYLGVSTISICNEFDQNMIISVIGDLKLGISGSIIISNDTKLVFGTTENNFIQNDNDNLLIGSTNGKIILIADEIDFPVITQQQWIPYRYFDTNTGFWVSKRDEISGNPYFYWKNSKQIAETFYLSADITHSIRDHSEKGFKLTKLYFAYEITTQDMIGITASVTKKTLGTTGITLTNEVIDLGTLQTETNVAFHYPVVLVDSNYLSAHEVMTVELAGETNTSSIFIFHGMFLEFSYAR